MLDSVTRKRIDNCRDILVGKLPSPSAQVEQITIALIYKFMDDMDRVTVEEYGGNPTFFEGDFEKYSWQNIYSPRTDAHQMLNLYAEGIQKMGQNPGLNPMFRSIFKDAFLPYRDPETLRLFLSTINEFSYEHSEMLGDAFEYLLSIMGSQGDAGQFRTPRHIIDFLVELVDPKIGETILDPACGTSGFLISAYKHILNSNKKDKPGDLLSSTQKKELLESINGYDISPDMVRLSSANLFLHGFTDDELNIHEYDTLSSEDRWNEYYDVIIANPPFMTPKGGIRPHNRFSVDSNRAEVLFTNYIMEHLTPKGRAGIVVPEGIIFQSGKAYKQLRKALVEKYLIGVISLPSGIFNPYSGVKTSILVLDKELSQKTDKIFFSKVENDGFDLGAQRRQINKNDLPKIKNGVLEYVQNLTNGINEEHPYLSYVSKDEILNSNDIGLSSERYESYDNSQNLYEYIELGELCQVDWGNTSLTKKSYTVDGDYIGVSAAGPDGKLEKFEYLGGNVVISAIGANCGKVFFIDEKFTAIKNTIVLHNYSPSCNPKYLYYILNKNVFPKRGGGQPFISKGDTMNVKIPLPTLEVQKEIVEELEKYQKVIDGAKQVVDNYKPSIDIDESWEKQKIGNLCEINPKKSEVKNLSNNLNVSFIPMADLNENNIDFTPKETRNLSEVYKGYTYFKNNDVLIAKVTPCFENGKAGICRNLVNGIGFGSSEYYVLRCNSEVLPMWIYLNVTNSLFKRQAIDRMTGTGGLKRVPKDFIDNYTISIPPLNIQEEIINSLEKEIQIVEGNRQLIEIYTQKIEDRINKIWRD